MADSSSPPDSSPPDSSPPDSCSMSGCSRQSVRRVSSAGDPPRSPPASRPGGHIRHRTSSYHHGSRHDGRGNHRNDKFYNLHGPPPLERMSQCISGFIRGTSTFLYVLPEYEAMELLNAIYHPGIGQERASEAELCELLSIAAIGSQYEDIGQDDQMSLFRSAKWYLDSGFGRGADALRRMRTSMLVGLFLVFEKSFWARDYIDQAIGIARQKGLNLMQRNPDYSEREWASWKRVWGSLVFLDGWLSGSLGSLPTICEGHDPIYNEGYRTCTNDLDAYLHAELIKLGILMGEITKKVYTTAIIEYDTVALYSARLKSWHSSLPEFLRLYTAVSYNDPKQRSTILLAHCSYLSSIILLTRRIYMERLEHGVGDLDGLARMAVADEYAEMCVSAGRQLATVVGLLHEEGRIVRRCWLLIQAAYTAGLVVLLNMSSKGSGGVNPDPADAHDQELITKCLGALQVTAVYDLVAQRFLEILISIRRSLVISANTNRQQKSAGSKRLIDCVLHEEEKPNPSSFATSSRLTRYILDIFRQPFGGESKVIGQEDYILSRFFPDNWRFLPAAPAIGQHTGSSEGESNSSLRSNSKSPDDGGGGRDPKRRNSPPFRTKEEYEAFFRRIS